jgi:glutathione S-transferase
MITVYHLDQSRSERIIWLLEELGLEYRLEVFLRQPDLYGPVGLKEAHFLGRAPVIRDGDVLLAESGAIVEYLTARHGQGRLSVTPAAPEFPQYLYWLHYAEGSLMLQLLREWTLDRMLPNADVHPGMARVRDGTKVHLAGVEARLLAVPYFAGEAFTAADIMMAYPFTTFRRICPVDLSPYPAIERYVARLEARPAFQVATRRFADTSPTT